MDGSGEDRRADDLQLNLDVIEDPATCVLKFVASPIIGDEPAVEGVLPVHYRGQMTLGSKLGTPCPNFSDEQLRSYGQGIRDRLESASNIGVNYQRPAAADGDVPPVSIFD